MKEILVVAAVTVGAFATPALAEGGLDGEVIKRSRARPDGKHNLGTYAQTRVEYRRTWARFGFRSDRPQVHFGRRRVVFVGTTESSSCPLVFRRVELVRRRAALKVHLVRSNADQHCTHVLARRSFVISLRRSALPDGELAVQVVRH
jgi:hypothetical protein